MRTPTRFAVIALSSLLFAVVVVAGCGGGHKSRSRIEEVPVTRTVTMTGLTAPVDIVRDEFGRAHVYAHSQTDAARAAGWLHAEDRMIQLDLARRLGSGTLAELVGAVSPNAVKTDATMRAIGLRRAALESIAAAPQYELDLAQAYADGVNAKIADFTTYPAPEYAIFGIQPADIKPWTPADSLVISKIFAFSLNWDGGTDLALANGKQLLDTAFPAGTRAGATKDLLFPFLPPETVSIVNPSLNGVAVTELLQPDITWNARPSRASLEGALQTVWQIEHERWNPFGKKIGLFGDRGSNNWVVSGAKTASGHALLCNDPHLSLDAPPIWYPLHLNTVKYGGTLDVEGVSVVGTPAITLGGNGNVAWAFTNTNPDTTDVYLEKYSMGTGTNGVDQVLWDPDGPQGPTAPALVDLVKDDEVIATSTGPGTVSTSHVIVWRLPFREPGGGVIIPGSFVASTNGGLGSAMSWRWAALQASDEFGAILALNTAKDATDIHAAADKWTAPEQNWVFADVDGHIGYVANAKIPIRADDDADLHTDPPQLPMNGFDGAHEWTGWISRGTVPQEDDPARGWIASANQDPLGFSFDGDPYNDAWYLNGIENDLGFRGARIASVLNAGTKLTVADMQALQGDDRSNMAAHLVPLILPSLQTSHATEAAFLAAWGDRGFRAASGVGNALPATEVDDAGAASLFNVFMSFLEKDFLGDEFAAAGIDVNAGYDEQLFGRTIMFVLRNPTLSATYDPTTGESALWDDMTTPATVETSAQIIDKAMSEALTWLASPQGFSSADPTDWRWGLIHRLTISRESGLDSYNIPNSSDPLYPKGFPRHADQFSVDVGNGGYNDQDFTYGDGASMREVIDLTPGRMRIYNILPGGVSADPNSPHYDDQARDYANDKWHEVWYREADVAAHAMDHVVLKP